MQGRGVEIAQTLIDRRLVKRGNGCVCRQRHVQPAGEITKQPGVLQHMAQIEAGLIVARQGGTADATLRRHRDAGLKNALTPDALAEDGCDERLD